MRGALLLRIVLAALLACSMLARGVSAQNTRAAGQSATVKRPSTPPDAKGRAILRAAGEASGLRILVSTEDRWLWLVSGRDTLMSVPLTFGMVAGGILTLGAPLLAALGAAAALLSKVKLEVIREEGEEEEDNPPPPTDAA